MKGKGNLLVSTKSSAPNKKIISAAIGFIPDLILLLLFFIIGFDGVRRLGRELFGNASMGLIVFIVVLTFSLGFNIFNIIVVSNGSRSYVDVYEYGIVGKTTLSWANPNAPVQDFELPYSEIKNISDSKKNIVIYTAYHTYEVLASENHDQALQEIRNRMSN